MKRVEIILSLIVLICLGLALITNAASLDNNADEINEDDVKLPKIFDFIKFKKIFNKNYKSLVEELARQKIFLGRAFNAFVSYIGFKHYKENYYLSVNERSDRTEAELRATFTRRSRKNKNKAPLLLEPNEGLERTPVANIDDIKSKLNEISDKPEYAHIINELNGVENRKRRSLNDENNDDDRANLKIDDLFSITEDEDDSSFRIRIPSNNPNYEPPELTSFGADDVEENDKEMKEETSSIIAQLPGAEYVGSLLSTASSYLFSGNAEEVNVVEAGSKKEKKPKIRKNDENNKIITDHRFDGCFRTPKNQHACGSCFLFSTTALYEWRYCNETGNQVRFSEQYALDCGERQGLKGCDGGEESEAAEFYGHYGLMLKQDYPYKARSDICPYEPDEKAQVMGYIKLRQKDGGMVGIRYDYIDRYLEEGPIAMGVLVPHQFSFYKGGLFDAPCDEDGAHSMVIVGRGISEGREYYILRNSYGPNWGEKGHIRIPKDVASKCFMDDGLGYFLRPKVGDKLFRADPNAKYKKEPIEKRLEDLKNKLPIPHNPFTYIDPNHIDENAVVNRD